MITKLELKRQIFHICVGIIIVALLYFELINELILFIAFLLSLFLSFLVKKGYKLPFFSAVFDSFGRKSEKRKFPAKGAVFYLLGSALSVFFFEKNIAIASILILAFGDSVSRLVGPFGYLKHPFNNKKFIEGIIAGGIVATLAASIFVPLILAIPALPASTLAK